MSKYFSKLKGERQERSDLTPSANSSTFSSNNPYREDDPPPYAPPHDPPPSHEQTNSLSRDKQHERSQTLHDDNLPPYHDWTVIPDTALLPPPPSITNEASTASNASYDDAARAHAWCDRHPLYKPQVPNADLVEAIRQGRHGLDLPPSFNGTVSKLDRASSPSSFASNKLGATPISVFRISTARRTNAPHKSRLGHSSGPSNTNSGIAGDQCISTQLPLFFASSPVINHQTQTIYFEILPLAYSSPDATVSLGFVAKPYPPNRQPGWHRASLAVHGDDGRRYVNDPWGGREFTAALALNKPVGLAMTFRPCQEEGHNANAKVYFVRDGSVEGGWDVDEERDAEVTLEHGGVEGLMGERDLYAAVGTFGIVEVEIRFYAIGEGFVAPPPT